MGGGENGAGWLDGPEGPGDAGGEPAGVGGPPARPCFSFVAPPRHVPAWPVEMTFGVTPGKRATAVPGLRGAGVTHRSNDFPGPGSACIAGSCALSGGPVRGSTHRKPIVGLPAASAGSTPFRLPIWVHGPRAGCRAASRAGPGRALPGLPARWERNFSRVAGLPAAGGRSARERWPGACNALHLGPARPCEGGAAPLGFGSRPSRSPWPIPRGISSTAGPRAGSS